MSLFHDVRIATGVLRAAKTALSATLRSKDEVICVRMSEDGQRLIEATIINLGSDSISLSYDDAKWLAEQLTRIVEDKLT